jgi:hypothetical protein
MAEPLSPRAQKVLNALNTAPAHTRLVAAAVIRALVGECAYTARYHAENSELNEMVIDEADALAIAAELEGREP